MRWRLLTLLAAMVLLPVGAARADSIPPPENDPFYAVPANIARLANGTILASREVSTSAYFLPMPARAWQVKYKSLDSENRPTSDVATLLVPQSPWPGGSRPLLSYQTAEDGVGSQCAPSYALRAGLGAGITNSALETGLMELGLLRGWAVVVPDYEGPRSAFLGSGGEAHGVLDGDRAALAFKPAGLGPTTPVGLWGYSGGAFASSVAAQAQPGYAPALHVVGVALGGEPADVEASLMAFSGSPLGGAMVIGLIGVDRAYPDANIQQYLNAAGRQALAASQHDCINDAAARFPFARIEQYEANPGVFQLPAVVKLMHDISPLGFPGTPTAPVYDYHSINDELAPLPGDRALMHRYCAAGTKVQHVEDFLSEHILLTVTGAAGAMGYLGERFAGKPAPSNCSSIPAPGGLTLLGQLLGGHLPGGG
jgi:hypothetical protein